MLIIKNYCNFPVTPYRSVCHNILKRAGSCISMLNSLGENKRSGRLCNNQTVYPSSCTGSALILPDSCLGSELIPLLFKSAVFWLNNSTFRIFSWTKWECVIPRFILSIVNKCWMKQKYNSLLIDSIEFIVVLFILEMATEVNHM